MTKPTALVTAPSSSIGAELSRIFAAQGYSSILNVALVASFQPAPGLANQLSIWSHYQPPWLVRLASGFALRFSPFTR